MVPSTRNVSIKGSAVISGTMTVDYLLKLLFVCRLVLMLATRSRTFELATLLQRNSWTYERPRQFPNNHRHTSLQCYCTRHLGVQSGKVAHVLLNYSVIPRNRISSCFESSGNGFLKLFTAEKPCNVT